MDTINVAIRIRPSLNVLEESMGIRILSANPPVLFVKDRQQHYMFDNIFNEDVKQKQLYEEMVKPLLDKVLSGYNCTVFAYGQTGTGKTYTIGSDPQTYKDVGFIVRALDAVFDTEEGSKEIRISISFFEIYNEKVFDLLGNSKSALSVKGFQVQGLAVTQVNNSLEARELLKLGSKNRHTGDTKQNRNSSRSHAIFTIHCHVKHENFETDAKLNLVDLAGSESARKTGCEGSHFEEGININKGLLHVGMVINALSTNKTHIPYRRSMLTTILQDSLDKRNFITFVACISPDSLDIHETVQTLQFAQRAKKLRNKPEINNIVQQFKKENPGLFEKQFPGSAVKVQPTPLKRQNYQSLQYSESKKPKVAQNHSWTPMNTISEPLRRLSPTSLISMSVSSISTISDITPAVLPSLSPLVRPIVQKCAEVFESTMMEKLQVIMNSHSRRLAPDGMSTPPFSMQRLHSEVTQIVKSEMIQFAAQKSRACSSPINADNTSLFSADETISDLRVVAKRLEFDEEAPCMEQTEPIFKLPMALPRKMIKGRQKRAQNADTTLATELNDNIAGPSTSAKPTPRRSTRLSLRKPLSPTEKTSPVNRRQSARLTMKRQDLPKPSPKRNAERDIIYPTPAPRKKIPKATPAASTDGSAASNHNQYVLNILNAGDQKELQKLPAVGAKTAAQIYFYRQLHGQFGSIADLGKMESWRGTGYQRFLKANLLKVEDDK